MLVFGEKKQREAIARIGDVRGPEDSSSVFFLLLFLASSRQRTPTPTRHGVVAENASPCDSTRTTNPSTTRSVSSDDRQPKKARCTAVLHFFLRNERTCNRVIGPPASSSVNIDAWMGSLGVPGPRKEEAPVRWASAAAIRGALRHVYTIPL